MWRVPLYPKNLVFMVVFGLYVALKTGGIPDNKKISHYNLGFNVTSRPKLCQNMPTLSKADSWAQDVDDGIDYAMLSVLILRNMYAGPAFIWY